MAAKCGRKILPYQMQHILNTTWWERHLVIKYGRSSSTVILVLYSVVLAISLVIVTKSAKYFVNPNLDSISGVQRSDQPSDPIVTRTEGNEEKKNAISLTPEWVETASRILKNMNPKIKPCDDFYQFACGGFEESTTIPDDKSGVNMFSVTSDQLKEQLRAIIEEPSGPHEQKPFTLTKNFYKACMNKTAIEKAGLEPLHKILRQLGKWPVIEGDNWKEDNFNWIESTYKFRKLGYLAQYFISLSIDRHPKNGTRHAIYIDQASLGLSREYLTKGKDNKIVKAYFEFMVDIVVMLGANEQRAARELTELLEFEIKLANITLTSEEERNPTLLYNPMTIAELKKRYPSVDWKEYINKLLAPSIRVSDNEIVIVTVPSFFSELVELLRTTPKRVQANYLMWRFVKSSIIYLSEDISQRQLNFVTVLSGKTKREARWKECVDFVAERLPISTGALYVRKYFKQDAKKTAVEMVTDVRREFTKILEKVEWMDAKTRSKALQKVAYMSSHIAYPDEFLDDEKLEEFHASLELRPDDFFGNIRNLSLFHTKNSLETFGRPVNKSEWIGHSQSANVGAFYSPIENSIEIPAGILQGMFFSDENPRYVNYGAIGYVIGHEITHGFDDRGTQYDEEGNLQDWWTPETKAKYLRKAECIVYQYGNYTVESLGLNLNGIYTQGENIADNSGTKIAYLAYKEWMKRNGPEPKLQGLKYTPEQMFWISIANTWCSKYRPEFLKSLITTNNHSPGQFRVRGPLSNMPEFAADFNCPIGSAMNPEHKCSVW